ncbi:bifunctional 4-hydroxy-2-oxoglutarate aldolase/2-dehydro-3-deoxy-phosphogluconate aldolase [Amorphus coralli]|uniref:bifunctional 4-hydroxy-2-oxoglutarate aldolase/2-dehydro-3-deoxy-phosphogluconate aldolase n=1 Tax=Amorphus coralli TaxID=340680 RepID=UPI000382BF33|nr:bifunctional 4-hydroxy-2-oxoglutarate aldolase/2-dehydro-3-deoxy-phosphogluconate aldolase [Amorphus coralli]
MSETFERLKHTAIPVVRTGIERSARVLVDWLREGGMSVFEITTSVPGHDAIVRDLAGDPDALVGMGTVLDADGARRAIDAGADFLVSPCVVPEVIETAVAAGCPVIAGAATPTEVLAAHRTGATAVKIFPIRQLGGHAYLKAVRSVLPFVGLVPTGGIEIDEVDAYFQAGALAVGLGSQLARDAEIEAGDKAPIVERASRLAARS